MSYVSPPKTAYGDQDFIKEDTTPQDPPITYITTPPLSNNSHQPLPVVRASPYVQPSPYGQLQNNQQALGANRFNDPTIQDLLDAPKSMTQEDILFINAWRHDAFIFKVIPLAIISNGANYYYNITKGLPHKMWKYCSLTAASYGLGTLLSMGDLRRRVEHSTLNTPFMLAMKKLKGVAGHTSEFKDAPLDPSSGWSTTGDGFSDLPYHPSQSHQSPYSSPPQAYGVQAPYSQPHIDQYNQPGAKFPSAAVDKGISSNYDPMYPNNQVEGSDGFTSKPASYEELRARNRGFMPPR